MTGNSLELHKWPNYGIKINFLEALSLHVRIEITFRLHLVRKWDRLFVLTYKVRSFLPTKFCLVFCVKDRLVTNRKIPELFVPNLFGSRNSL